MENNESGKVRKLIERDALIILESYSGANNYILYLQDKQSNNPRFLPTRSQSDYIVKYSETIPKIGRRWVDMDPYFAKKIANENGMIEIPKQVWVEKLLVEKEKSYHIWAKYNEKDKLNYINKTTDGSELYIYFWVKWDAQDRFGVKVESIDSIYATRFSNPPGIIIYILFI